MTHLHAGQGRGTPAENLFRSVIAQAIRDAVEAEARGKPGAEEFRAWALSADGREVFSLANMAMTVGDVAGSLDLIRDQGQTYRRRHGLSAHALSLAERLRRRRIADKQAEHAKALELRVEGLSMPTIARRLGRSQSHVHRIFAQA